MFAMIRLPAAMLVALALVGCGGGHKEFSPEEFAAITKGMPEADAMERLGPPEKVIDVGDVRRAFWAAQGKYYSMSFTNGQVSAPMVHTDKKDYDMMIAFGQRAAGQMKKGDPK